VVSRVRLISLRGSDEVIASRFITHRASKILLVDMSNCLSYAGTEMLSTGGAALCDRSAPRFVLILGDFTRGEVRQKAFTTLKKKQRFFWTVRM